MNNDLLRHQLQQARISNYQIEKNSKSKNELEQIIKQLHSIVLELPEQPSKPVITNETESQTEPNEISTDTNVKPKKTPTPPEIQSLIKPDDQYEPVSEGTLQMLDNLMKNPDRIENPFELAELLYLSGHAEKAVKLYQEALSRKDPNDPDTAQEKAWILFQIGNCLRNKNSQAAKNTYRKLIAAYPDHLWTDFAKVQEKIIDWYLQDKPHTLIKECKQLVVK